MTFAPMPQVIAAIRRGEQIILVDDEDRENEGDLVIAAQHADAKAIAFMATKACGLICLAMEGRICDRLGLPLMTTSNHSRHGTAFTSSIEAREGVTTGISAADRARTIAVATAIEARPEDIVVPGHVFPLRARDGGVLVRAGHTEAAVDLARLAGCTPAAVICEIMKSDGTMARLPDLRTYAADHGLLLATIADLISWRETRERLVDAVAEALLETPWGQVRAFTYFSQVTHEHHLALVKGDRLRPGSEVDEPVLVRVQKAMALADVFGQAGPVPVGTTLKQIAQAEDGVLLYMHDADGRGLHAQLAALGSPRQDAPVPGMAMDYREYGIGAQILHHLGVRRMRLVTASDRPIASLSGHGLEIVERVKPG